MQMCSEFGPRLTWEMAHSLRSSIWVGACCSQRHREGNLQAGERLQEPSLGGESVS